MKWTLGGGCLGWFLPCCWCYKQIFIIEVCVVWCVSKHVKQRGMLDVFVIIETINEYAYCIVHRQASPVAVIKQGADGGPSHAGGGTTSSLVANCPLSPFSFS